MQLPVRLLVFAILIHLEETMANVIRWKAKMINKVFLTSSGTIVDGELRVFSRARLVPDSIRCP